MKRGWCFAALVTAVILMVGSAAEAQTDLNNIKEQFKHAGMRRPYGFDFDAFTPSSSWVGEINGVYGHYIADTAVGWVLEAFATPVGTSILTGSVDVSDLESGTLYYIKTTGGAFDLDLDAAPSNGEYFLFVIGDASNNVVIDVDGGGPTDYSLWGADKTFKATTDLGQWFVLYSGKTAAGALRWAISHPKNEYIDGTLEVDGQADFDANLDANLGLDVSGAAQTFTGTAGSWTWALADSACTQTGTGLVTFTGNVDASNGLDVNADNKNLTVGDSGDLRSYHDGFNSFVANSTGQVTFQNLDSAATVAGRQTNLLAGDGGAADGAGGVGAAGGQVSVIAGDGGAATADDNGADGGAGYFDGGAGGAGSAAGTGLAGEGGASYLRGGTGGAGGALINAGKGGNVFVLAGNAGAAGGLGGPVNGGNAYVRAGNATGAGSNGTLYLGDANTSAISLGSADNPTIIQVGTGQVTFLGNVNAALGLDVNADSQYVTVGADGDFQIGHDGTTTTCTNSLGDLVFDNTDVDDDIVVQLGTDSTATAFKVKNDTGDILMQVLSGAATAAAATVNGDFAYTGYKLAQGMVFNAMIPIGANWTAAATGEYLLPLNMTNQQLRIQLTGLKIGDKIQSYTVLGGFGAAAAPNTTTVTSQLHKVVGAAGGVTDTALGVGDSTGPAEADDVLMVLEETALNIPVDAGYAYFILIDGTTANNAACDVSVLGASLTVDRK